MGTALVIPTKDVKMLIPNTAASLQRALRKPKAVVLRKDKDRGKSRNNSKNNSNNNNNNRNNMSSNNINSVNRVKW